MGQCQTDSFSDILSSFYIPPQPKLIEDIRQVGPDLPAIANLIAKEPSIASQVLIRVNSPFYGLRNRIASVQQASMLLGLDNVLNVVRSVLLRSIADGIDPAQMEKFWHHSNNVAFTASLLSKELKIGEPDEAFTLGLFHNCGIPLIAQKYPDYWATLQQAYASTEGALTELEDKRFNTNHAVVSYLVAKAWRLPEHLCEIIRDHHIIEPQTFSAGGDSEHLNLFALLKMAEHICQLHWHLGEQDADYEWQRIAPSIIEYVGLSEYDYMDHEERIREKIESLMVG